MTYTVGIIGAGAWGIALSEVVYRKGYETILWCRNSDKTHQLNKTLQTPYLPHILLSSGLQRTSQLEPFQKTNLVLWALPAQTICEVLPLFKNYLNPTIPIILCSKGIHQQQKKLLSSIVQSLLPNPIAVLSGPNFAIEVAQHLPAAATLACHSLKTANNICKILKQPTFRLYASQDVIGVQVAGAVKNVLAIACGIVYGKKLGLNALSALITRGLAEMRRLGVAMGGKAETFMGLSAVGDLTLTCTSELSRNMSLGKALGQALSLSDALSQRKGVAEGYHTSQIIDELATMYQVRMPICSMVKKFLCEEVDINYAIEGILNSQEALDELT